MYLLLFRPGYIDLSHTVASRMCKRVEHCPNSRASKVPKLLPNQVTEYLNTKWPSKFLSDTPLPSKLMSSLLIAFGEEAYHGCEHCEYKTTQKGSLLQHIIYSCEYTDHKAKWKRNLLRHVQSLHEVVTYSSEHCDYKSK